MDKFRDSVIIGEIKDNQDMMASLITPEYSCLAQEDLPTLLIYLMLILNIPLK